MSVLAIAPPTVADSGEQTPDNGAYVVGADVAPDLHRTGGTTPTIGVWINNLPAQDEMCLWFTYSTPDAQKDHVI